MLEKLWVYCLGIFKLGISRSLENLDSFGKVFDIR